MCVWGGGVAVEAPVAVGMAEGGLALRGGSAGPARSRRWALSARLEDEEGHGRGRRWQPLTLPVRCAPGGGRDPVGPEKEAGRF